MTITAKVIADSISESGVRITTLELEYPRYIHSQFMTHRQFSRNAQSSRAIPTQKQIELIENSPIPDFAQNQAGMQAGERLDSEIGHNAKTEWDVARLNAIESAEVLLSYGVHKQWANRLLEPFSTIKVVVTATEWDNFFALRLHHDAQPEIQELAQSIKVAMDESEPKKLTGVYWHLPYVTLDECDVLNDLALVSAARCARVSYLNHDNTNPDIEKDLALAKTLLKDGHLSPFEHQAYPINDNATEWQNGVTHIDKKAIEWSANFRGWIQHRQRL